MRRSISPRISGSFMRRTSVCLQFYPCRSNPTELSRLLFRMINTLLASDHKTLDAGLQIFPFLADLIGLVGNDPRRRLSRFGDRVEQLGKIAHHVAGLAKDRLVEARAELQVRVGDKEPAGLVAQPADQADVLRQRVHLADAVERVLGAALLRVLAVGRRLAPLVNQRLRNLERRRHRLDARLVDRLLDDFIRFHGGGLYPSWHADTKGIRSWSRGLLCCRDRVRCRVGLITLLSRRIAAWPNPSLLKSKRPSSPRCPTRCSSSGSTIPKPKSSASSPVKCASTSSVSCRATASRLSFRHTT